MRNKGARGPEKRQADWLVARISALQHGVVSARQLATAGISRAGITRRVQTARLHRVFRGVYAVGHTALSNEGRWMAAVLACGKAAVLSHRSAAELWGMLPPSKGDVDVTIPTAGGRRKRDGVRLHRSPSLPDADTTNRKGVRVTAPARTVADLRRVASVDELRRAVREAEFLRLDLGDQAGIERDLTRNKLERRFLRVCRRHRLPKPEVNVKVGRFEADFLWRDHRLIVETDGYGSHGGRIAFEDDRARDLELKLMDYDVVRFTWRQVTEQPEGVAARLRVLLARPVR